LRRTHRLSQSKVFNVIEIVHVLPTNARHRHPPPITTRHIPTALPLHAWRGVIDSERDNADLPRQGKPHIGPFHVSSAAQYPSLLSYVRSFGRKLSLFAASSCPPIYFIYTLYFAPTPRRIPSPPYVMGLLNLLPLIILFVVVGAVAWVGYQVRLPILPPPTVPSPSSSVHQRR
jgi:hypothetical protein